MRRAAGPARPVNLALQGGGSHGAYAWGVLDAIAQDGRLDIVGISGASAGAMNAVVYAAGLAEGGPDGARARLERFRLSVDHVMASACLPTLFQAVQIEGDYYWDGGYAGNPPLWPLFCETACRDAIIVQINPIERTEVPGTPEEIANRLNEITFNSPLLAELRAADFVARLIRSGVLKSEDYRLERLHRIGGVGRLESYDAATKFDVSWLRAACAARPRRRRRNGA